VEAKAKTSTCKGLLTSVPRRKEVADNHGVHNVCTPEEVQNGQSMAFNLRRGKLVGRSEPGGKTCGLSR
jgi:hypothetical protein